MLLCVNGLHVNCRTTTVTELNAAGVPIDDTMAITGHKSKQSVNRYLHRKRDGTLFDLSEKLDATRKDQQGQSISVISQCTTESKTMVIAKEKKMKLTVNGNTNVLTFEFCNVNSFY